MKVLLTGATGYIGGHLGPRLLDAGHEVRALVRDLHRLPQSAWVSHIQAVKGDVRDEEALAAAITGCDVAYYLIHSMRKGRAFHDAERRAAMAFAAVAKSTGGEAHRFPRCAG
ncbi:MAG: NAD-dependent epimerase/dehydratase family protein [SAR202 cluster bacterium]|nr:NAD-dependent epimerase/dehydratase family protein [SAR202 cluster bacterium]